MTYNDWVITEVEREAMTRDDTAKAAGEAKCLHPANVELERGTVRGARYRILLCVACDAEHVQSSAPLGPRPFFAEAKT